MKTEVIVTVVDSGSRTWRDRVISFAGAILALMVVPAAILVVGLPVALIVRAVIEFARWLAGPVP